MNAAADQPKFTTQPWGEADAIKILFGVRERYEKFHAVAYTDEALTNAVHTSSRFIPDRYLHPERTSP